MIGQVSLIFSAPARAALSRSTHHRAALVAGDVAVATLCVRPNRSASGSAARHRQGPEAWELCPALLVPPNAPLPRHPPKGGHHPVHPGSARGSISLRALPWPSPAVRG